MFGNNTLKIYNLQIDKMAEKFHVQPIVEVGDSLMKLELTEVTKKIRNYHIYMPACSSFMHITQIGTIYFSFDLVSNRGTSTFSNDELQWVLCSFRVGKAQKH